MASRLRRLRRTLPPAAVLVLFPLAGLLAQEPVVQHQDDVAYMTGGVGEEERETMVATARQEGFNLRLTFANPEGLFMAGVGVRITDADGAVRLETTSDGPWLFARLPAGEYGVRAEFTTGVREVSVSVPEEGMHHAVVSSP